MSSGVCGCLDYDLSQGDDYKTVKATMAFLDNKIGDYPEDVQRRVVEHLCSGTMNDGDHLQVSQCCAKRSKWTSYRSVSCSMN